MAVLTYTVPGANNTNNKGTIERMSQLISLSQLFERFTLTIEDSGKIISLTVNEDWFLTTADTDATK